MDVTKEYEADHGTVFEIALTPNDCVLPSAQCGPRVAASSSGCCMSRNGKQVSACLQSPRRRISESKS